MPYTHLEERMLGEYVSRFLGGKKVATHVRLGWPRGVDRTAPDAYVMRQMFLSTLVEADLVVRQDPGAVVYEFTVYRPQNKIAQLQLYRKLLPDTPGYEDLTIDRVGMKLVTGLPLESLESIATDAGIAIETYAPAWLLAKVAERRGGA